MIILKVLNTGQSSHIFLARALHESLKSLTCSSSFIVVSTNDDEPDAADDQDSLVEESGLCEENHMQLVPVNYFMDNTGDDSGKSQL